MSEGSPGGPGGPREAGVWREPGLSTAPGGGLSQPWAYGPCKALLWLTMARLQGAGTGGLSIRRASWRSRESPGGEAESRSPSRQA